MTNEIHAVTAMLRDRGPMNQLALQQALGWGPKRVYGQLMRAMDQRRVQLRIAGEVAVYCAATPNGNYVGAW